MSIYGPREDTVHGSEVGGEGVTYNAPLLCARAHRKSAIIFEGHSSTEIKCLNE